MDPLTAAAALGAVAGLGSAWQMRRRALRAEARLCRMTDELRAERYAAGHDPLTGLPNRRTFHNLGSAMLAAVANGQRLAAVLLDLDDFKMVNDRFGHAAGDEVLVTVARRFAAYAEGDLVARLGGDEFAGLIRGHADDEGWLRRGSHRLADVLAAPMRVAGEEIQITASVGLAPVPRGTHLTEALRRADAEMYRAKARRCRDERHHDTDGTAHPGHACYWMSACEPEAATRPASPRRAPETSAVADRQLVDTSTTPSPDLGGS